MSLPFCGSCLRRVIADYGVQHDRAMREQWRDYHVQQLTRWKSLALDAVGVSSAIGAAIAGTTSVIAGAAAGLARGAVATARGAGAATRAALEDRSASPAAPADADRAAVSPPPAPHAEPRPPRPRSAEARYNYGPFQRLRARPVGHCAACWEGAHRAHIGYGDCMAEPTGPEAARW